MIKRGTTNLVIFIDIACYPHLQSAVSQLHGACIAGDSNGPAPGNVDPLCFRMHNTSIKCLSGRPAGP